MFRKALVTVVFLTQFVFANVELSEKLAEKLKNAYQENSALLLKQIPEKEASQTLCENFIHRLEHMQTLSKLKLEKALFAQEQRHSNETLLLSEKCLNLELEKLSERKPVDVKAPDTDAKSAALRIFSLISRLPQYPNLSEKLFSFARPAVAQRILELVGKRGKISRPEIQEILSRNNEFYFFLSDGTLQKLKLEASGAQWLLTQFSETNNINHIEKIKSWMIK